MDLLETLEAGPLSLTEVTSRVGINKITGFRILANLEGRGYVERVRATGHYRLGLRLAQLGARSTESRDLRVAARPTLEALQAEFDETVNLAVPGDRGVVYMDILERSRGLRMTATVGEQHDYHCTALGKAMMAFRTALKQREFLRRAELSRRTPHTLATYEALERELETTRERGFAVDNEENEVGGRCVGAPIFDREGDVIGAISVSGPTTRITPERVDAIAARVTEAARHISERMGYLHGAPQADE